MLRSGFIAQRLAQAVQHIHSIAGIGGMASGFTAPEITEETPESTTGDIAEKAKFSMGDEMRTQYKKKMSYDDRPVKDIILSAAKKGGVDANMLFSSAFGEGMNVAVANPGAISTAYKRAVDNKHVDGDKFPVDGYSNYGLDTFGDSYERLKKYLPQGFQDRFKTFYAINEKGEAVNSAAFQTNEDALVAKSAMLRDTTSQVEEYAKKKGITINAEHKNYFTLAGYNGGIGNARQMIDEYAKTKDKDAYVSEGLTSKKQIHKNISSRLENMRIADQLLNEDKPVTTKIPMMRGMGMSHVKTL